MRCARTSTIFAFVCVVSVTIPACEPVSEIASWPRSSIAISASAHEMRSPTEISMSIARGFGRSEIWCASVDELVGRVAHRREHGDDAAALLLRATTIRARPPAAAPGRRRTCRRTSSRACRRGRPRPARCRGRPRSRSWPSGEKAGSRRRGKRPNKNAEPADPRANRFDAGESSRGVERLSRASCERKGRSLRRNSYAATSRGGRPARGRA